MTTTNSYIFPFGQTLHQVIQSDLSPKKAFVLGVYASAVHARWIDQDGNQLVAALAVASEPEEISGKVFKVIPLCHPRQAQRLGASSVAWYELHKKWVNQKNNLLITN